MRAGLFGGEGAGGEVAGEQRGDGGEDQEQERVQQAGAEAQGQDHGQGGEDDEQREAGPAADAFEERGEFVEADFEGVHGWVSARRPRFPPTLMRWQDGGSGADSGRPAAGSRGGGAAGWQEACKQEVRNKANFVQPLSLLDDTPCVKLRIANRRGRPAGAQN